MLSFLILLEQLAGSLFLIGATFDLALSFRRRNMEVALALVRLQSNIGHQIMFSKRLLDLFHSIQDDFSRSIRGPFERGS